MPTDVRFAGPLPLAQAFVRATQRAGLHVAWTPPEPTVREQHDVEVTMYVTGDPALLDEVIARYVAFFADVSIELAQT